MSDIRSKIDSLSPEKLALLASMLKKESGGVSSRSPIPRRGRSHRYALSFGQQRLWFIDQLDQGNPAYNLRFSARLKGRLDHEALEASLTEIARRHEVLRASFVAVDGVPEVRIAPQLALVVPIEDLSALPRKEREARAHDYARSEALKPFDLTRGPLVRASAVRLDEEDHLLLGSMHHIVADGWSVGILMEELNATYEARVNGKSRPLPELPIQYTDYTAWQLEWLHGPEFESQLEYWKQQLRGVPALLDLPTDKIRPATQSYLGDSVPLKLDRRLAEALRALAVRNKATTFMVLLAAFYVLLYRYTQQEDLVVGVPVSNRSRTELEKMIGFFANTLAYRTRLSSELRFVDLLNRVRQIAVEANDNQDLPFEILVHTLQPARSLDHSPLYQVMFSYLNTPTPVFGLSGLGLELLTHQTLTAQYDLSLRLSEEPEGIEGSVEYRTDLFEERTILQLSSHFVSLLSSIARNPDSRIGDLDMLTEAECRELIEARNSTAVENDRSLLLHRAIEVQARRTPDAMAVVYEDECVSYRALNEQANRLAHFLMRLGAGPEVVIGVRMERSLEMVTALLAVLKTGSAYLPLEPEHSDERIEFMLRDAGALLFMTAESGEHYRGAARCLSLLDRQQEILRESADDRETHAESLNLAYVIYTSGSTGRPKGVMNTHRGICNRLLWMQSYFGDAGAVLQKTPFSFDVSVWEFFWPLMTGATLVVSPPGAHRDPAQLRRLIADHQITTIHFVPSMLQAFLAEGALSSCPSLTRVICSGEALTSELRTAFFRQTSCELYNLYGPTEAAVDVTAWKCGAEPDQSRVPIGSPISNIRIYLLDGSYRPAPSGARAELYIGGDGVGRGYVGRADLTAASFPPNPFPAAPGDRVYRTGDLARYRTEGELEFLARADHQVKIRGFRVEPGEIEEALRRHPRIADAVVVAAEFDGEQRRLVAYVVNASPAPLPVGEIRSHLAQSLPEYMVPSAFEFLDAIPLTSNGKIDRKALPAFRGARPELAEGFVPPASESERALAAIWRNLLGIETVGVNDKFFELGGDSILAIQMIARAARNNLRLTLKQVFQHQTIAELARAASSTNGVEAEQGMVSGLVPLTPIQHWFFENEFLDPHHFNQSVCFEATERIRPELLRRSIGHLLGHHDALRLRFARDVGGWRQVIGQMPEPVPLTSVDLSVLSETDQQTAVGGVSRRLQAGLDLTNGPLMRVGHFRFGGRRPDLVLIVIHHLAVDGISWRILLDDLQTVYEQLGRGRGPQPAPKTSSFKQWSERLDDYARSPEAEGAAPFWIGLSAAEPVPLPIDYSNGDNSEHSVRTVHVALGEVSTQALLHEVSGAYNTRIDDILLTALARSFARWTGQWSLLIELEWHGRDALDRLDLSRTVGWFTTIAPVLLSLDGAFDIERDIKAIKEQLRRVPNNGLDYGVLRYLRSDSQVAARLRQLRPAPVLFNYLGRLDQALSTGRMFNSSIVSTGPVRSPRQTRPHLLEINCMVSEAKLQAAFAYSDEVHAQSTITELARSYIAALQALIDHCRMSSERGHTPSDFPMADLNQNELDQLLSRFGQQRNQR
jgi:amino acid adenylation domain-containing protein/non-ribosomal peptide synthase protein (TIGR01720 family)